MDANRLKLSAGPRSHVLWRALFLLPCLLLFGISFCQAQRTPSVFDDGVFEQPFVDAGPSDCEACDPEAAAFDSWENITEGHGQEEVYWDDPRLKPFDWVRHMGFRHSSTHGRHIGRGLPLEKTSWLNRPYHVDWFSGPLLGDELIANRVSQDNELFGGLRIGWDFDYYWGLEARFGWSNPNVQFETPQTSAKNGSYFVSDIDFVYYPWGDSKIRPYMLFGAGMARIEFTDEASRTFNTTLFTTPLGGGIQFRQTPWMIWRFEVLDNLSYGADDVDTMHNISLTAGMELRFGSRPASSYWPWRSSRKIW